jgi:hypothetical protein
MLSPKIAGCAWPKPPAIPTEAATIQGELNMIARIRTVKPEMARHKGLFDLQQETKFPIRFVWAMMPTICDRAGRFRWRPWELKLDILPYDDGVDFARVLDALATRGFLVKYAFESEVYGCIPTFHMHQVVNNREKASTIPCFTQHGAEILIGSDAHTTRAPRVPDASITPLVQDQGEGNGTEGEEERNGNGTERTHQILKGLKSVSHILALWDIPLITQESYLIAYRDKGLSWIAAEIQRAHDYDVTYPHADKKKFLAGWLSRSKSGKGARPSAGGDSVSDHNDKALEKAKARHRARTGGGAA